MTATPEAGRNMWDLAGWQPIGCEASDAIRANASGVSSSLTDPDGTYGPPITYTEWCDGDSHPVLRDYLPPPGMGNCRHLAPSEAVR